MSNNPLVTIGIVSCNRFHYLKALIESARQCIQYDNVEWIVVDNASIESGLREYLDGLDFVQHKIYRPERSPATEHVEAMNKIIELSRGDYVMILPEDVQFIVQGAWLKDLVELVDTYPHIGSVGMNAIRRITIERFFGSPGFIQDDNMRAMIKDNILALYRRFKPHAVYTTASGQRFLGYGPAKPGIVGSGIMSFGRKAIWQQLGPWKSTNQQTVADSSGGGETEMLQRYKKMGLQLERVLLTQPVLADIVTDARGTKARIRGNKRYGKYFAPPDGKFYYKIWSTDQLQQFTNTQPAIPFEDIVESLGYALPYDSQGSLLKNPFKSADDEFEWIDPSVVGLDIK